VWSPGEVGGAFDESETTGRRTGGAPEGGGSGSVVPALQALAVAAAVAYGAIHVCLERFYDTFGVTPARRPVGDVDPPCPGEPARAAGGGPPAGNGAPRRRRRLWRAGFTLLAAAVMPL
jgi:hypothetical protein